MRSSTRCASAPPSSWWPRPTRRRSSGWRPSWRRTWPAASAHSPASRSRRSCWARWCRTSRTRRVLALACRPPFDGAALRAARGAGPIVLLEDPRDLGNVGAVVRVAAGAGAAGVVTTGMHDPWDAAALRGSAGLHFALPVGRDDDFVAALAADVDRPAPPAAGARPRRRPARPRSAAARRRARVRDRAPRPVSDALLARADARLRLPMRAGVSSLNLATAVAAVCSRGGSAPVATPRLGAEFARSALTANDGHSMVP